MILPEKESWLRMLFHLQGTSLSQTWPRIALVTAFACLITYGELYHNMADMYFTALPFQLVGVALGIYFGFRNNGAYDRFWEGRKLWGALVNTSRSLARQVLVLAAATDPNDEDEVQQVRSFQQETIYRTIAYCHALKHHLRGEDAMEATGELAPDDQQIVSRHLNRPIAILELLGHRFREAWQRGWVDTYHLPMLEARLTDMTDIQGGCERIKSTPIPYVYSVLLHRIVAVYCFALPLGTVEQTGIFTPLVVFFISYAFFGLDEIGDELEEPFGYDPNDLPLSTIATTIEINLRQMLNEMPDAELPKPVDGIFQ